MNLIKVLQPDMPPAAAVLPYLLGMDESRIFVNNGPLLRRLEDQLTQITRSHCTVVSNGTVSMELALRAMSLPSGSNILVPAVTYVATGQAIVNAGHVPVLCDVDPDTWQLTAERAAEIVTYDRTIRAVVPVAAFGLPVPIAGWERFSYDINIPVLIDAAGAILCQETSVIPEIVVSYSLHATKAVGAGEGGVIATCDLNLLERVASLANFGPGGTNAKMSEYHAAVALASLQRLNPWRSDVCRWYEARLPASVQQQRGAQLWRTLFPVLLAKGHDAAAVCQEMRKAGIETKQWYRPFLDERAEFGRRHRPLPVTDMLRARMLGLPFHAFLTEDDVVRVCDTLSELIA